MDNTAMSVRENGYAVSLQSSNLTSQIRCKHKSDVFGKIKGLHPGRDM